MANVLPGDGRGVMQVFPIKTMGSVSGAGSIDVSDYELIIFDTDVTFYIGSASSSTFDLPACTPIGIGEVDSIHVDTATNYMVV